MPNYQTDLPHNKEKDEHGRNRWVFSSPYNEKVAVYGQPYRDKDNELLRYRVIFLNPNAGEHYFDITKNELGKRPRNTVVTKSKAALKAFEALPFLEQ
jgi:hypothetical protein